MMNKEMNNEVDLVKLIIALWKHRRPIIRTTIIFIILGLIMALLTPKEYTVETIMVPQLSDDQSQMGGLSGLAAIAGFDFNVKSSGEISPAVYPKIIKSIPFLKELMYTEIDFRDLKQEMTIYDFYLNVYKKKIIRKIRKYTIGLPGLVIDLIKGHSVELKNVGNDLMNITENEEEVLEYMSNQMRLEINEKDGFITLAVSLSDRYATADLAEKTQELLQQYITEFKVEKAQDELNFIKARCDEKYSEFKKAQNNLALFRDRNKNVSTSIVQAEEDRLESEYNLAYSIYNELAKQLENAKIKVKRNTPVFTIIEPAVIPIEKSKPNRTLIMILSTLLGIVAGVMVVFTRISYKYIREKYNG